MQNTLPTIADAGSTVLFSLFDRSPKPLGLHSQPATGAGFAGHLEPVGGFVDLRAAFRAPYADVFPCGHGRLLE
jgi:hypothetical protein